MTIDEQLTEETRRDRWGRYLVVPPEGGKPIGYVRATTIAKTLDDQGGLMNWGKRMTALGLAARPDLLTELALIDPDDKKQLDKLCEKAAEAGGATVRRDLGTAVHSIFERYWTDPAFTVPPAHVADVEAVENELAAAGLQVVEGFHERIVVNDSHGIAGTFDLLVTDGENEYVADLKTGSSVKYGALGFAIQLGIYATADALYTQGPAKDGSQDRRDPMPALSTERAVIIHIEPGTAKCDLYWLDLTEGLRALELAMQVREARKQRPLKLVANVAHFDDNAADHFRDYLRANGSHLATSPADKVIEAFPGAELLATPDTYDWLKTRVVRIFEHPNGKPLMQTAWPEGVPTFRSAQPFTVTQADQLAAAITTVEKQLGLPFPDPQPGVALVEPRPTPSPRSERPDDTTLFDPDTPEAQAVAQRYAAKPERQREWIAAILQGCRHTNRPIHLNGAGSIKSLRRLHLIAGLVAIADCVSDDLVAHITTLITGQAVEPERFHHTFGSLDLDEAVKFRQIADAIDATELEVTFGETIAITGDINAATAA